MLRSLAFLLPIAFAAAWYAALTEAQLPVVADATATDKFPFVVVESFDAKYEGDTPGHLGRHGGLGDRVPRVALGDAVYRGDGDAAKVVGKVTNLKWTRGQGALDIELDPTDMTRIAIGDHVWLKLGAE